jgi:hypothetical protein
VSARNGVDAADMQPTHPRAVGAQHDRDNGIQSESILNILAAVLLWLSRPIAGSSRVLSSMIFAQSVMPYPFVAGMADTALVEMALTSSDGNVTIRYVGLRWPGADRLGLWLVGLS